MRVFPSICERRGRAYPGAGAITSGGKVTADSKIAAFEENGIHNRFSVLGAAGEAQLNKPAATTKGAMSSPPP